MTDNPPPPDELIEHLNHRDCMLFVGDALDGEDLLRRFVT